MEAPSRAEQAELFRSAVKAGYEGVACLVEAKWLAQWRLFVSAGGGGVPPPGSLRRQLSSVEERLFEHEEASRASQRAMAIEGDSSSSSDSEG